MNSGQGSSTAARVRVKPREAEPAESGYEVVIGPGALALLPDLLAGTCARHRYALIADETVAGLYASRVEELLAGSRIDRFTFPAGERSKSLENWMELSDRMFAAGLGRDAAVLALGGGVTGDLAGFVAATYMRGVPLVQLPTSLLAMIDSSVGGKTGVDTPRGKNLVGAFLQPELVVADMELLRTLDPRELRAGLAEAIKHGAIADEEYFDWIEDSLDSILALEPEASTRLVRRSVELKAAVVAADEREAGLRKTLNFGHTIGHALEALSGYSILHGEAIATGMVLEARLAERIGVAEAGTAERLATLLARADLPVDLPAGTDLRRLLDLTLLDKKARQGSVAYSLLERIGRSSPGPTGDWGHPVPDDRVMEVLRAEC